MHNRRSIELAIVKQDVQEKPSRKKPARAYSLQKTIGVSREMASPSPLSDLDSYHVQDTTVLLTPRTVVAEGKEPFETPMSQIVYASVASITPGSTSSPFGMPLEAAHGGSSAVFGNRSHERGDMSNNMPGRFEAGMKRPALGHAPPTTYKKHRASDSRKP